MSLAVTRTPVLDFTDSSVKVVYLGRLVCTFSYLSVRIKETSTPPLLLLSHITEQAHTYAQVIVFVVSASPV